MSMASELTVGVLKHLMSAPRNDCTKHLSVTLQLLGVRHVNFPGYSRALCVSDGQDYTWALVMEPSGNGDLATLKKNMVIDVTAAKCESTEDKRYLVSSSSCDHATEIVQNSSDMRV